MDCASRYHVGVECLHCAQTHLKGMLGSDGGESEREITEMIHIYFSLLG